MPPSTGLSSILLSLRTQYSQKKVALIFLSYVLGTQKNLNCNKRNPGDIMFSMKIIIYFESKVLVHMMVKTSYDYVLVHRNFYLS